jgi:hypothetical protein
LLSKAEVKRIQATRFDRSQVKRVYLAPGLGSMVLFPCALVEVFVGRSEDLRVQVSPNDKKTLFLNLKLNSSLPTNLIAKCDGEKSVYVFDVIPSKSKHQDVVEIRSSFGGPSYEGLKPYEVSTSKSKKRILMKAPALVGKGAVK